MDIKRFANAIAKAENSPADWNNPGSLTGADKGSFQTCGFGNKEGVWKFVNKADGELALEIKCARMLTGKSHTYPPTMTLAEVGMKYSGGNPDWSKNVAAALGISETTTLAQMAEMD